MRLKSIIASAFTALMVACPVLAFSESADFDDSVPDTDETMTIDTPASNADSNDVAWLSASKEYSNTGHSRSGQLLYIDRSGRNHAERY